MNGEKHEDKPVIGVLAWEGGGSQALAGLEAIPGNMLHPDTFDIPLRVVRVDGANYHTVVERPDRRVLDGMITASRAMAVEGIRAITTSCGFNAIFQQELAAAAPVPVFTSSLLQVPLAQAMIGNERRVGVLTADSRYLTRAHLVGVGIDQPEQLAIAGMEESREFTRALSDPEAVIDPELFIGDIVAVATRLRARHPDLGALVLECTDLPPASEALRAELGLPVFDIVTLVNMVCRTVAA
ncbi:MAG: aspartate/glutamate racemase family protein [Geothermobacteraceae bacterium]